VLALSHRDIETPGGYGLCCNTKTDR